MSVCAQYVANNNYASTSFYDAFSSSNLGTGTFLLDVSNPSASAVYFVAIRANTANSTCYNFSVVVSLPGAHGLCAGNAC